MSGNLDKTNPWKCATKPAAVFVEITSHCNMKCKFCPSEVLKRKKSHMRPETVFGILEECKGKNIPVTFHVLGEPLLNSHFFDYAEYCDKAEITYVLTTNGTLCTKELSEKLFSLKYLANVHVSFHTFDSEAFKLRGSKMDFEEYMRNINNLLFSEARYKNGKTLEILLMYDAHDKRLWGNFTETRWTTFISRVKEWERCLLEKFPDAPTRYPFFYSQDRKLAIKGKSATCKGIENIPSDFFAGSSQECVFLNCQIFPNTFINLKKFFMFGQSKDYLKFAFDRNNISVKPAKNFSCMSTDIIAVLSNGDITFCCRDYEGELSCGNIKDMTLTEALESSHRHSLIEHPDQFEFCRNCKGEWA